jgi:hypothetical protein
MIVDNRNITFEYPKGYLEKHVSDLRRFHPNAHIETVRLKDLGLDDASLRTYHTATWGDDPSEYDFDESEIERWGWAVPYASKRDGKLWLGDGKHRMRALMNAGYTHVPMIVL